MKVKIILLLLLIFQIQILPAQSPFAGQLKINEYSCANRSMADAYGNYEDWVEILNSSTSPINISGFGFSKNPESLASWTFPSGTIINSGNRLLIFCSKRNISAGGIHHTNFTLSQISGDKIILSDASGLIIDSLTIKRNQLNHSRGRTTDGASTWSVFSAPTPNAANAGAIQEYAAKVNFSSEAGFYPSTINITLSTTESESNIRYTTDGTEPTPSSTIYSSPIVVSNTQVIRARVYSNTGVKLPGFIETNTYFINESHTLPVFSICGNQLDNLMGGNSSLKPVGSTEFFDASGTFIDEAVNEFNKHGNDSWAYDQRGVDIVVRDAYGYSKDLDYNFFANTERDEFSKLILKAAANDNYPFKSGGAHLRDAYIHTISQNGHLNLDERTAAFVAVYKNGSYWGIYDLREKVDDKDFTDYYYNQDEIYNGAPNDVQFNKTWGGTYSEYGTSASLTQWNDLVNFVNTNDMSVPGNVDFVLNQLDFNSMIDYFILNSFMVSQDWLNWNTGWWRGLNPDGENKKWKYILWDQEYCLGFGINYTGLDINGSSAPPCQPEDITVGEGHAQIFKELITNNPTLKEQYIMRYIDLVNSYFSCEYLDSMLTSMKSTIEPEMPKHILKWGGSLTTWQNNVETFRDSIFSRCEYVRTALTDCYDIEGPYAVKLNLFPVNSGDIKVNTITYSVFPKSLSLYGVLNYHLKALPKPGYTFSHWTITGGTLSPDLTSPEVILPLSSPANVTAHFIEDSNPTADLTPIYYWHFNNFTVPNDSGVSIVNADYKLPPTAMPSIQYTGINIMNLDPVTSDGSNLNLLMSELPGQAMRVRNPSVGRSLIFNVPSTGYDSLIFRFAVRRTNSGQLINHFTYSIDGSTYASLGLSVTSQNIDTNYQLVTLDFTSIAAVNNNANFKIKINYEGNNATSNGNNRYDNIALFGRALPSSIKNQHHQTQFKLFPNPASYTVYLKSTSDFESVKVVDVNGKVCIAHNFNKTKECNFSVEQLPAGVYFVMVEINGLQHAEKLVISK